jgi:hypothetical protein
MGEKLPPDQLELYRRTDEVLHYIWDPIGIADVPEARDEYHSYLPRIFELLLVRNEEGIRNLLRTVTCDNMGLDLTEEQLARIDRATQSLIRWRTACIQG